MVVGGGGALQRREVLTSDNPDVVSPVFGAFDSFLVETQMQFKIDERMALSFGADNMGNEKYNL